MNQTYIGHSLLRVEGASKLTGKATYIDDINLPGLLHAITIRSPVSRGTLNKIIFDPKVNWDEFIIVTHKDIPGENFVAHIMNDQPCLVDKQINHLEEPIVLIAHEDKNQLFVAKNAIYFDITQQEPVLTIEDSLAKKQVIWGENNVIKECHIDKGDVDLAFQNAHKTLEKEYRTGAQEHLYLENNGIIATYCEKDGITVQGSIQCPYFVHHSLVEVFKLPEDKVRVVQTETGGAFGGKEDYPSIIGAHAALLAYKSKRPVKLVYDRHEDLAATTKRHPSRTRIKSAIDKNGKLLALDIEFILDGGAYSTMSPVVLSRGAIHSAGPYFCPNVKVRSYAVATNSPPYGAFRGFGAPQSFFALEKHIDDLAKESGLSPEEIRRNNFVADGLTSATSQVIKDGVDLNKLLDKAFKEIDYKSKRDTFTKENPNNHIKKGIGFSTFMHGSGFTGSGEKRMASVAAVEATNEGKIKILVSSVEMGQGKNTVLAQIVADTLNVDIDIVENEVPDTSKVPNTGPTVASRTTMVVGNLVHIACKDLKNKLHESGLLKKDYSTEDFQKACKNYIKEHGELKTYSKYKQPSYISWDENTHKGDAYSTFAWAVYVAEVSVNLITYEVKVDDFVAVQEIGRVVNPTLAEGQIEGGVAQGIGYALYENVILENGCMKNTQMTNYTVPSAKDLPRIRVFFDEVPAPDAPFGAKGIGELPMDGVAPAIANAIEQATGTSFTQIPILPEDIMDKLENSSE